MNFKIMAMKHTEQTKNNTAIIKYNVSKINNQRLKQQKQTLQTANCIQTFIH
jgi:hypothetical protein